MNISFSIPESLKTFLEAIQKELPPLLGDSLKGLYIYGSLSYGDFEEKRSDVDIIAILNHDLTDEKFTKLENWYESLKTNQSDWLKRLEMNYVTLKDVLVAIQDNKLKMTLFSGEKLKKDEWEDGACIELSNLRESGIPLFGLSANTIVPEISEQKLLEAHKLKFEDLKKTAFEWVQIDLWNQCYIVVQLCRRVYALETGIASSRTSKKKAAEWCAENVPGEFRPMVRIALEKLDDFDGPLEPEITNRLPDFIKYIDELFKKKLKSDSLSKQFSDPLLVSAYDALNAFGDDSAFWIKTIERLAPKTIIDLGCGTGLLTIDLANRGYHMIGIEPAGAMVEIARKKPLAEKVQWIVGGYEKFEGLETDIVLMTSHVAQFFLEDKEWEEMIQASYKALKPGGYIIFDSRTPIFPPYQTWPTEEAPRRIQDPTLGPIDWYYKLLEIKDNRVRYQLHFHFINSGEKITSTDELIFRSQEEITKSLEGAGFKVETIYGDWDESLVTPNSPEMIFVAERRT